MGEKRMKIDSLLTAHIKRSKAEYTQTVSQGDNCAWIGTSWDKQTCLNLTFRLIQCWTFFVELGLKRIYMMRSIYRDFKILYKALKICSSVCQPERDFRIKEHDFETVRSTFQNIYWKSFSMMIITIIISTCWLRWMITSGAVCLCLQHTLVGGFLGCSGSPQPWPWLVRLS